MKSLRRLRSKWPVLALVCMMILAISVVPMGPVGNLNEPAGAALSLGWSKIAMAAWSLGMTDHAIAAAAVGAAWGIALYSVAPPLSTFYIL